MLGLMHSYASLLMKEGITSNAISPAPDRIRYDARTGERDPPDSAGMGRFGVAEEVASIAVLLATNGFMTGQTINPNGGLYFTS